VAAKVGRKKVERDALEDLMLAEKAALAKPTFTHTPTNEWKVQRDLWNAATEDERKDYVCGMVFVCGLKKKDIAKFFHLDIKDLEQYNDIIEQSAAMLVAKVRGHQIQWAWRSNHFAAAKFFLGKQFGNQVENPMYDDVQSLDEQKEIKIHVINTTATDTSAVDNAEADPMEARDPAGNRLN
jgi:hypothetical protein